MREENLLRMIGEVDENYILEAAPEAADRRKLPAWIKAAVIAACLCLVWLLSSLVSQLSGAGNPAGRVLPLSVSAADLGMEDYTFGVTLPHIVYADSEIVIMYDFRGIYVYSLARGALIGYSDFRPIDMTLIQGDNPTFVRVSRDGREVRFFNNTKKYVYDTQKNETREVSDYDEPFEEYFIETLPIGDERELLETQITCIGVDGRAVSLDLRYEDAEQIRYKNLVLLVQDGDTIKEYVIFQ